jgi:ubiquitin-conjugating enzyme (huntingtin interacting protein 2)
MLLESPNPKDPQDAEVAKMMMEDPAAFARKAHEWAVKYAGAPRTDQKSFIQYQEVQKSMLPRDDDPARYVKI